MPETTMGFRGCKAAESPEGKRAEGEEPARDTTEEQTDQTPVEEDQGEPSIDGESKDQTPEPISVSAEAPEAESTEAPAAESTEAPEAESTEAPAAESTEAPEAESTEAPAAESTEAPATEMTEVPETDSTEGLTEEPAEAIEEDLPEAPEAESTEAPAEESPETPMENPTQYPAQSLTGNAGNISVAVAAPEGAFPMGTEMKVQPVDQSATLSDIENAVAGDFVEVRRIYAVDISFWCNDEEIEPLLPVGVVLSVSGLEEEALTVVVHVDDEGNVEVVAQGSETEIPAAGAPAVPSGSSDGGEDARQSEAGAQEGAAEAGFTADRFSVYALVVIDNIDKRYLEEETDSRKVTVAYGPDAGISANASLQVTEITDEVEKYDQQCAQLLPEHQKITNSRYFDIKIIDNGGVVLPLAPVEVRISVPQEAGELAP